MEIVEIGGDILGKNNIIGDNFQVIVPEGDGPTFDVQMYVHVMENIVRPAMTDVCITDPTFLDRYEIPEKDTFSDIIDIVGSTSERFSINKTICIGDHIIFANGSISDGSVKIGLCYSVDGMIVGMSQPDSENSNAMRTWSSRRVGINFFEVTKLVTAVCWYEKYADTICKKLVPGDSIESADGTLIKNVSKFDMTILKA